jgi:HK97 family phage major capsid protein
MSSPTVPQARQRSSEKPFFVCSESFDTTVPGHGRQSYKRGQSFVAGDADVLRLHASKFVKEGELRATAPVKTSPPPAAASTPKPYWWIGGDGARTVQTPRPGVARGDAIYDLTTLKAKAGGELRDRAKRSIEAAQFPHARANRERIQAHLETAINDPDSADSDALARHLVETGSPEIRAAFRKVLTRAPLNMDDTRALSVGIGAKGGFAVPFTLDPTVIATSSPVQNPLRRLATNVTTAGDVWKGLSSSGVTSGYQGEATETEDEAPAFEQPTIATQKADAWIPFSYEIGEDWGDGLEVSIAELVQEAMDRAESIKFLNGTGTNEPLGLLTALSESVETVTKEAFVQADIEALEASLPTGFLETAQWLGHREILKKVRALSSGGATHLWAKVPGQDAEMMDLPVSPYGSMDSTLAINKRILLLGDFSKFIIADRIGMRFVLGEGYGNNHLPNGSKGMYVLWRNGTALVTKEAFRALKVKAS